MASGLGLLRFKCTACGNCCRSVRVPVTDADVRRLALATGRPALELVEMLPLDMSGEPETTIDLAGGRRVMVLRFEAGGCSLLGADGLCGAYSARPLPCRSFPFHATFGRRGGIRRLRLLPLGDCPWERGERQDPHRLRALLDQQKAELREYARRVRDWNRRQHRRRFLGRAVEDAASFLAFQPSAEATRRSLASASSATPFNASPFTI
jgi:Fe-S-cluster containining protein